VADHHKVRWFSEPGRGVEKEFETSPIRELTDRSDDRSVVGNAEPISPPGSVRRSEPVLERYRQHGCRQAVHGALKIAFKARVGKKGGRQPPIEVAVVRIVSDVAGVAECADQRAAPIGAGSDAQEVVVGEMTDDDVTVFGQSGDRLEIRSEMRRLSFLDEAGHGPRERLETPIEVATADKEQPRVDPGTVEGTTVELGHGSRAGPFVREDDHADLHALENSPFFIFSPDRSDVRGRENETRRGSPWQNEAQRVVFAGAISRWEASMTVELKGRSFLKLLDFTPGEIRELLALATDLKAKKKAGIRERKLDGRNIALLFEKPSTRTRCAFTVACIDEGAHPEYLGKGDIQFGKKETVADTARVLGRMFDGIEFRGFAHQTVETLAEYAGVPVWNGLTDDWHPTQFLADVLTMQEESGDLAGQTLAYVGDGRNNVAHSLMVGCAKLGMHCRIVSPEELHPEHDLVVRVEEIAATTGGSLVVTSSIDTGVASADAIYTDVWASMGEEALIAERIRTLGPYKITEKMMASTGKPGTIFLHCLPAFHNLDTEVSRQNPDIQEVEDAVFEGPQSRVFDQAENRLHTIKAVMVATLGD
jgi:ornithine carbamoyltransferase